MKRTFQLLTAATFATGISGIAFADVEYPCGTDEDVCAPNGEAIELSLKCFNGGPWTGGVSLADYGNTYYYLDVYSDEAYTCTAEGYLDLAKTEVKCQDGAKKHEGLTVEMEAKKLGYDCP